MRRTLRRSCSACAKSKYSCDLGSPQCSRCIQRKVQCIYANEPLTARPAAPDSKLAASKRPIEDTHALNCYNFGSFDPFESYPHTRLPREHVERFIHKCTSIVGRSFCFNCAYKLSPSQNCFPILSSRFKRNHKPVHHLLVATCFGRSSIISCLATNSMSR